MSRLQAVTHAAGRVAEARLLLGDWVEESHFADDSTAADIEAAHGCLTAALRLLTAAMVRESREEETPEHK